MLPARRGQGAQGGRDNPSALALVKVESPFKGAPTPKGVWGICWNRGWKGVGMGAGTHFGTGLGVGLEGGWNIIPRPVTDWKHRARSEMIVVWKAVRPRKS